MTLLPPLVPKFIQVVREGAEPLPASVRLSSAGNWLIPVDALSDEAIEDLGRAWVRGVMAKRDSRKVTA